MKSWIYTLFGIGKIRKSLLLELKGEGIVAFDEGVKATITYKISRAPRRYSHWKRRWFSGAFILTQKRLILRQFSQPVINILLTDERLQQIKVSVEKQETPLFEFEPQLFLAKSSGKIEWRLRTLQALKFAAVLKSNMK